MPKFKKKKSAVGADFKRVKSKVGKKLPKAQNATDTSFRSKRTSLTLLRVAPALTLTSL